MDALMGPHRDGGEVFMACCLPPNQPASHPASALLSALLCFSCSLIPLAPFSSLLLLLKHDFPSSDVVHQTRFFWISFKSEFLHLLIWNTLYLSSYLFLLSAVFLFSPDFPFSPISNLLPSIFLPKLPCPTRIRAEACGMDAGENWSRHFHGPLSPQASSL